MSDDAVCSGFVATFTYNNAEAPKYRKGHSITIGFVALAWVAMFCNVYVPDTMMISSKTYQQHTECTAYERIRQEEMVVVNKIS